MKILLITQNFPPDIGGASNRTSGIAHYLSTFGHQVTVLCANPIYPRGKIFPGYKNKWLQKDKNNEYVVYRTWIWPVKPKSPAIMRILSYLSFVLSASIASLKIPKQDIIIVASPPLFVPLIGIVVKQKQHTPLVLDITDIWPESANATGFMKKGWIFKLAEHFELFIYKHCDYFVPSGPGEKQHLIQKGIKENKIHLSPNATDTNIFVNIESDDIVKQYNLNNKYVVGYAGLLGFAQNPIIIIETAREFQNYKNIIFFIVGEGGMKIEMEQLADKYKLNNVIFVGEKPRKEIPYYINTFSCCLIPYKNTSLFTRTIPSKLFDYLAAGKPVIINLEGYASQIITTANAGLVAQPDNSIDLAKQILYLHNNIEIAKQMGINGRKYVEQYYDREKLLKELELFLINIVQK